MVDQLPVHQPDSSATGDSSTSQDGDNRTLLVIAAVGLGAAMLVLAFRGGSLNVNSAGITMTVNPPG